MISRELVLELLRQKQDSSGGYSGDDIIEIAKILEVTPRGLRRRLTNWINTDDDFQQFIYLGKKNPPLLSLSSSRLNKDLNQIRFKLKKECMKIFIKEMKPEQFINWLLVK